MTPLVVARLALLLAGIALFLIGIRTGQDPYRYVAIGLLAVAVLIRFIDRNRPPSD